MPKTLSAVVVVSHGVVTFRVDVSPHVEKETREHTELLVADLSTVLSFVFLFFVADRTDPQRTNEETGREGGRGGHGYATLYMEFTKWLYYRQRTPTFDTLRNRSYRGFSSSAQ